MRTTQILILGGLSLLTLLATIAEAQSDSKSWDVSAVEVRGNRIVTTEALTSQLKAKPGRVTQTTISDDTRSLYRTGFFKRVVANIEGESVGKFKLVYQLEEKLIIRKVWIDGNEDISESELADLVKIEGKRFLSAAKTQEMAREIQSYYQAQGYYDAEIDTRIDTVDEFQADLVFIAKEGKRYKIRDIVFRGADGVEYSELRDAIQTKRYKWWNSWLFGTGRLNSEMLENDRQLVRQVLLDHGFVEAKVGDALVEKTGDDDLQIVFEIVEGAEYKVGEIAVSGDLINHSPTETLAKLKLETGEVFSASKLRADTFTISDRFADIGYAYVNVVPNTKIDREQRLLNIDYSIDQGKQVTVREIKIRGNEKTYDHVVRRELVIQEQELFSASKVRRSQELLQRLGYFEEVNVSTESTDEPDKIDLAVNVREGSTGTFSIGAGYSSSDGMLFNSQLSEENLFGTGKRLVLNVDVGEEANNLVLGLSDRRLNDSYWSGGIEGFITDREFDDFDQDLRGASVTVGYPMDRAFGEWAQDINFSVAYDFTHIDITNVDPTDAAPLVIESEGKSTASGFIPRLIRNTINNPLNPTHGSKQTVTTQVTGLGGSDKFWLVELANQWYHPLVESESGDLVFSWRTRFGYGESFNSDDFPLYKRYFPGGINSVRGYDARSLGPTDENGNEYGGNKQLINNFELIFPLINAAGIKGVIFYDAGQAFDDDIGISISDLRLAYGFGIRWNSPLGPLRLEFGFPIDKEEGESGSVTLFSFGAPI